MLEGGLEEMYLLVAQMGLLLLFSKAIEQAWWTKVFFGLRCDLKSLPPIRPAKMPVKMEPNGEALFSGFEEELRQARGLDYLDVFQRRRICRAGVKTAYVTLGPDGSPAYVQWLIRAQDQQHLHAYQPKRYPVLASDEVLLEGAYTFTRFRRTGVMADGMGQLLRIAQAEGVRAAYTYVGADNVGSLRGCANVGFVLDHVRRNTRRLGYRISVMSPADEEARRIWSAATVPRVSA
jgi:hypothetical protein